MPESWRDKLWRIFSWKWYALRHWALRGVCRTTEHIWDDSLPNVFLCMRCCSLKDRKTGRIYRDWIERLGDQHHE